MAQASPLPAQLSGQDLGSSKPVSMGLTESPKATVVVFLSAKCPCSASHEKRLADLYAEFSPQGFKFVGIHSNIDEPAELSSAHFGASRLPFPVLQDPRAELANSFRALKTPHVFVVNAKGEVVFQGGVDDSHNAATAEKQYLQNALAALAAGRAPPVREVRALGCVIKRP